ncbi:MAG: substrate-binding domain-containing protein, partial [Limnochordales bacterium]
FEAVRHLLDLNHRRIGIVRGVEGNISSDQRFEAILQAYRDNGLTEPPWIWAGDYSVETGIRAGDALAALPPDQRPTAVIAASEFSAYGLVHSLHDHGLSVPEDVSVVGFDNTRFAELFRPALTVIAQPIERMGRRAVETVLQMIAAAEEAPPPVAPLPGSARPRTAKTQRVTDEWLPTKLVVRASTGPAPRAGSTLRFA